MNNYSYFQIKNINTVMQFCRYVCSKRSLLLMAGLSQNVLGFGNKLKRYVCGVARFLICADD
jgi:hypothetical protein